MRLIMLCLCLFTFSALVSQAQAPWSYGVNPYYGGVLKYKEGMPTLKMTHLHGVELYAAKMTTGRRSWEKTYNYPRIGVAASYFNYGEPEELGKAYSLTSYLDFTPGKGKGDHWRINIGTGFVYSTRRFDQLTNPENKAVSSKVSYVLRGTVYYQLQLTDKYFLNFNIGFRHFSNGKLNIPNNGMNFPVAGVGLRYMPRPPKIMVTSDTLPDYDKAIHFNIMASTSRREVLQEDVKHKAYTLSLYAQKQITRYNRLLVGVDGFLYDKSSVQSSLSVYNAKNGITTDNIDDDGRQLAFTAGSELIFGKMSVLFQAGIYLYKPQAYYTQAWYQRYGFRYQVFRNGFINTTLKTHSRTADMVEFGVGFNI